MATLNIILLMLFCTTKALEMDYIVPESYETAYHGSQLPMFDDQSELLSTDSLESISKSSSSDSEEGDFGIENSRASPLDFSTSFKVAERKTQKGNAVKREVKSSLAPESNVKYGIRFDKVADDDKNEKNSRRNVKTGKLSINNDNIKTSEMSRMFHDYLGGSISDSNIEESKPFSKEDVKLLPASEHSENSRKEEKRVPNKLEEIQVSGPRKARKAGLHMVKEAEKSFHEKSLHENRKLPRNEETEITKRMEPQQRREKQFKNKRMSEKKTNKELSAVSDSTLTRKITDNHELEENSYDKITSNSRTKEGKHNRERMSLNLLPISTPSPITTTFESFIDLHSTEDKATELIDETLKSHRLNEFEKSKTPNEKDDSREVNKDYGPNSKIENGNNFDKKRKLEAAEAKEMEDIERDYSELQDNKETMMTNDNYFDTLLSSSNLTDTETTLANNETVQTKDISHSKESRRVFNGLTLDQKNTNYQTLSESAKKYETQIIPVNSDSKVVDDGRFSPLATEVISSQEKDDSISTSNYKIYESKKSGFSTDTSFTSMPTEMPSQNQDNEDLPFGMYSAGKFDDKINNETLQDSLAPEDNITNIKEISTELTSNDTGDNQMQSEDYPNPYGYSKPTENYEVEDTVPAKKQNILSRSNMFINQYQISPPANIYDYMMPLPIFDSHMYSSPVISDLQISQNKPFVATVQEKRRNNPNTFLRNKEILLPFNVKPRLNAYESVYSRGYTYHPTINYGSRLNSQTGSSGKHTGHKHDLIDEKIFNSNEFSEIDRRLQNLYGMNGRGNTHEFLEAFNSNIHKGPPKANYIPIANERKTFVIAEIYEPNYKLPQRNPSNGYNVEPIFSPNVKIYRKQKLISTLANNKQPSQETKSEDNYYGVSGDIKENNKQGVKEWDYMPDRKNKEVSSNIDRNFGDYTQEITEDELIQLLKKHGTIELKEEIETKGK